jgi:hypothetical protein
MKSFDMPVLVVGNKVDLTREVEESEVEDIQKDWGCTYIGTCTTMLSSCSPQNIHHMWLKKATFPMKILQKMFDKHENFL